ncbi:hypothetical protein HNR42_003615 [Deinobacterium chartae]|uniref:DUF309 domain-containing protein n=1 Tax=Deinobacterium chartae TaxID=521158 RepID=A0A841I8N7_9DEIO|nr:DUF309 domain-containing protein [Deinobacterium chartae]MBB6100145.1 hypothetical protein [Deinobacterium chartae]
MNQALYRGAELFNDGRYWEAHEAWEAVWLRSEGEFRHYVSALILLAAALHKRWVMGSRSARNYHKALRHLALLPRVYDGVDLEDLRAQVERALEVLEPRPLLVLTTSDLPKDK